MILFYSLLLLALGGQVELFKLGLLAGPQPDQAEYYPAIRQQYGYQQQIFGAPQPLPYQAYQPQALAYVIVRPIAPTYPYYDSSVRYWAPLQQQQSVSAPDAGIKGGPQQPALEQAAPTKGGSKPEYVKQEKFEQERLETQEPQIVQHQLEAVNQPPPAPAPPAQQPDQLYDMGLGKLLKIKSSFDKFAAGAKSKLTLGSRYYVSGEEFVTPVAPPQPLRQEQLQAGDIQLTRLEQQRIEDAGQSKLENQQIEDTSQVKVEENRGTKLEDTRQEKLIEQEPLREAKGLESSLPQQPQPIPQERYPERDLQQQQYQQQQYQQPQQLREEYQQGPIKAEVRDQTRFNGQQQATYSSGQIDSDGFGKRNSAL